jgi:predicted O-methyltransferase YrrM
MEATLLSRLTQSFEFRVVRPIQETWLGRYQTDLACDLSFTQAAARFPDRNQLHQYMHHYYRHLCPFSIRRHREYFEQDQRGFGERAFHAMWWLLLREFRPQRCLEIGVFRGQVITLWSAIARTLGMPCEVSGISPFSPAGDSVSTYPTEVDYHSDVLASFARFALPAPTLIKAFSTDTEALEHIASTPWDLIFVDGNHDYDVVLSDYEHARDGLKPGGILVMDDSSLGTSFAPPRFSSAGHADPSRVAAEFAMREFEFLGAVAHNNVFRKPVRQ